MLHHEQKLFSNGTFITDIIQGPSEQPEHIVTDNWKATFQRTETKGHFCLSYFLRQKHRKVWGIILPIISIEIKSES